MRPSTLSVNGHQPLSRQDPSRVVAHLVGDPRLRAARKGEHSLEGPRRAQRSEHDGRTHAVQPPGEHQPPEVSNQGLTVNHGAPTAGSGTASLSTGGATDYARVQEGVPLSMPSAGPKDTSGWLAQNAGDPNTGTMGAPGSGSSEAPHVDDPRVLGDAAMVAGPGRVLKFWRWVKSLAGIGKAARAGAVAMKARPDIVLSGGRGGELVKSLTGPSNSVVRGGPGRAYVTNEKGQVILDITKSRVKPVTPGQGFGPKRAATSEELDLLDSVLGGGG